MAKWRKSEKVTRRLIVRQRQNLRQHIRQLNTHRRAYSVRVRVPTSEIRDADDNSQRIIPGQFRFSGPICQFGIVREEVRETWPIGERCHYKCRYQVSLIIV